MQNIELANFRIIIRKTPYKEFTDIHRICTSYTYFLCESIVSCKYSKTSWQILIVVWNRECVILKTWVIYRWNLKKLTTSHTFLQITFA